jgi:hypothetical protein
MSQHPAHDSLHEVEPPSDEDDEPASSPQTPLLHIPPRVNGKSIGRSGSRDRGSGTTARSRRGTTTARPRRRRRPSPPHE